MRTLKEPEERKAEILDVAEQLFYDKGYMKCTVNEILTAAGIAKGTFYYYFASKEDVLDAVIQRDMDAVQANLDKVRCGQTDAPAAKLLALFQAMRLENKVGRETLEDLHKVENTLMHQKILARMISVMTPILVETIKEGIDAGVWRCRYPAQYMQIFLASALALTDEGIFESEEISQQELMQALIALLEKMLEVEEDSFMSLYISQNNKGQGDQNELAHN